MVSETLMRPAHHVFIFASVNVQPLLFVSTIGSFSSPQIFLTKINKVSRNDYSWPAEGVHICAFCISSGLKYSKDIHEWKKNSA